MRFLPFLLLLCACNGAHVPVPKNDRFRFIREELPFHGKVKSVLQTEYREEGTPKEDPKEWTAKDEYAFNEEGCLVEWTSSRPGVTDLEYSNNARGKIVTKFVSDKVRKEEIQSWQKEGAGYRVQVTEDVDGKTRSLTRRYDAEGLLLSEEGKNRSGEYVAGTREYANGRLVEDNYTGSKVRFTYGPGTDTQFAFRNGAWEVARIQVFNKEGDPLQQRNEGAGLPPERTDYTYQYDPQGNWVYRKAVTHTYPRVTITKREITYY